MQQQPPPASVRAVTIRFADLRDRSKDLGGFIEEGFGPRGLGIVSIDDVSDATVLQRLRLRCSMSRFRFLFLSTLSLPLTIVNLPDDVKKQLEDPDSRS
ncbi:unnamed protein product [Miscanthus lutarioriparius]|uniref:Uncharacterized protein n=1 Tax=Miscanthus lutarioriparius TaxID=422564 RepID=A0A811RVL2_9POAL|nr:unnamed protein product [Miscanthus lutarioriparius]